MTPRRTRQAWPIFGFCLLTIACESDHSDATTEVTHTCERLVDGAWQIAAERECYRSFPKLTLSGYWVVGFEHSDFYEDRRSAMAHGADGVRLELSPAAAAQTERTNSSNSRYFEVSFEGRRPKLDRLVGPYAGLTYVDRFLKIREIEVDADGPSTSTESPN